MAFAGYADSDFFERLKFCGVDPNLRNYKNNTAAEQFDCEWKSRKGEFANEILKAFGTDDAESRGKLLELAEDGDFAEAYTILESNRHLVNTADAKGWSALHHAASAGKSKDSKHLVGLGASPELRNKDGYTPKDLMKINYPRSDMTCFEPKAMVRCEHCGKEFEDHDIIMHTQVCEKAPHECIYCNQMIPADVKEQHKLECVKRPVSCEHCGESMAFDMLAGHGTSCKISRTVKSQGWAVKPVTDPDILTYLATFLTVQDGSQLGKGHDVSGPLVYHRNYSDMEMYCAWQISHPNKQMIYNFNKEQVKVEMQQCEMAGHTRDLQNQIRQTIRTERVPKPDTIELDEEANEVFLMHGCKPEVIPFILQSGLNQNLCSLNGMLGAGIYLAEKPEKIDQYCTADHTHGAHPALHSRIFHADHQIDHPNGNGGQDDLFYAFVTRCTLGWMIRTTDRETCHDTAIPIHHDAYKRELNTVPDVPTGVRFHTLVLEDKPLSGFRYREFVCFHATQTHVEFLIAYKRK
jgi:hypothetical protein